MKITGLLLWVQENRMSEKFYKKLGFDIVQSDDEHSLMSLGSFQVTLVTMRDEERFARDAMSGDKGRGMYLYVRVDDVDQKYQELLEQGFLPASRPTDWDWGNREFILKDLDGYKLCFWQPLK